MENTHNDEIDLMELFYALKCYFNISRVQFLERTEKIAFVQWLKNDRQMSQNDRGTVYAIIRLLEEEL